MRLISIAFAFAVGSTLAGCVTPPPPSYSSCIPITEANRGDYVHAQLGPFELTGLPGGFSRRFGIHRLREFDSSAPAHILILAADSGPLSIKLGNDFTSLYLRYTIAGPTPTTVSFYKRGARLDRKTLNYDDTSKDFKSIELAIGGGTFDEIIVRGIIFRFTDVCFK